ncbi:unnamed protein product [Allacma fusca]|uniref:Uncharacterized protein n=1 Tax=Allacma fusca TaxID=39272 RepID=A0A8J2KXL0_9HEXA|nr:unnamed protein product [Allacma fusca]
MSQPCSSSSFTVIATTASSGLAMTANPLTSTSTHQNVRKPRLPSQTSESLMSVGDDSVKSSERRRVTPEEVTEENKRVTFIVGLATGLIFLSAFILIAVTLKMTPKIDEIHALHLER